MPVRPPSTFEETVERLGTAIRLGLLPAGSRLPPERELAGELRISRSTLRQALTTLVQSGHLVSLRGRTGGTFVSDQPPLVDAGRRAARPSAWAVLDYRVAIETGPRSSPPSGPRPGSWTGSRRWWRRWRPRSRTLASTAAPTSASTSASPRPPARRGSSAR